MKKVAENRNLDIDAVKKLADGSTWLGEEAKEKGLIDDIGNLEDAKNWIRNELNIVPEVCVYE